MKCETADIDAHTHLTAIYLQQNPACAVTDLR